MCYKIALYKNVIFMFIENIVHIILYDKSNNIEHCITFQSVNKVLKTRRDVIKYLSWRELDWTKGVMRSAKRNSILTIWRGKITEESRESRGLISGS